MVGHQGNAGNIWDSINGADDSLSTTQSTWEGTHLALADDGEHEEKA